MAAYFVCCLSLSSPPPSPEHTQTKRTVIKGSLPQARKNKEQYSVAIFACHQERLPFYLIQLHFLQIPFKRKVTVMKAEQMRFAELRTDMVLWVETVWNIKCLMTPSPPSPTSPPPPPRRTHLPRPGVTYGVT